MANTININIRNCCCPGASSGGVTDVPIEVLPDPTGIEGPPSGYGPPSSISNRQCKVAIFLYEWIYWWLHTILNNVVAYTLVNLISARSIPFVARSALTIIIIPIISAAFGALVTWGINIEDVIIIPASAILGGFFANSLLNLFETHTITMPIIEDTFTKLPDQRDMIICKLSQAANQSEIYADLEFGLKEAGYSDGQIAVIFAIGMPSLLSLLYWSADWWPSFEETSLTSITETCCGTLEPGQPLLPGSITRCEASNYVLFQFLQLLQNTGTYVNGYWDILNRFQLDLEAELYDDIQQNLEIPRKIKETAYSLPQFQRYIAKYMADKLLGWNPLSIWFDDTFNDLAGYLTLNAEDIICGLFTSLNAAQASTVLTDEIDAFLAASTLSETAQNYVKTALLGIISGEGDFIGLLTTQDSDILGFGTGYECDGCGWVDPGAGDQVFDFRITDEGWLSNDAMGYPDPQYVEPSGSVVGKWWSGDISGSGTAKLGIYYPVLSTVDHLTVYVRGTQLTLNYLRVMVSDDLETWTTVRSVSNVDADGVIPYTFENLNIVNKYILVYGQIYWAGANVKIYEIVFNVDEA